MCIPGATRAIGLFNACFRLSSIVITFASYNSFVLPNGIPCSLYQLPIQLSTHLAQMPVGSPLWSISYDPSVYTIMSKGFQYLSQSLNFITAFFLLPIPPAATRQLSDPNKRFSHSSSSCEGLRYSTLLEHFCIVFSRRGRLAVMCVCFVRMRKGYWSSSLCSQSTASLHK